MLGRRKASKPLAPYSGINAEGHMLKKTLHYTTLAQADQNLQTLILRSLGCTLRRILTDFYHAVVGQAGTKLHL